MRYPRAPSRPANEVLAGRSFPDPFRSLEDGDDPAVIEWQARQSALAETYVATLPDLDKLRPRVARTMVERFGPVPRFAGGRWFRAEQVPGALHSGVLVSDEPVGPGRLVFDPRGHVDEHGAVPFVPWFSPSPDGRVLALGLCYDASEANTIRIVDVDSGALVDDRPAQVLMDGWTGGAQWLPDSGGFFFTALEGPREAFRLAVFRHRFGEGTTREAVPLLSGPGEDYMGVFVSRDGRYAVASQHLMQPRPVAVLDLTDEVSGWRPFVTDVGATLLGHVIGDEYVAVADWGAPRGRLVAVPIAREASRDPAEWRVLLPESEAVLRSVTPVGDLLYVSELVDTYARVRIVDLDGTEHGCVPLPGRGALAELPFPLMALIPRGHPSEYVFSFSTLTESWGLYRHNPGERDLETLREPEVRIEALVEDRWATSRDGTRVPYHLVRRADVPAGSPQPTLIEGYGGYNVPRAVQFPRGIAAFVESGGVFVHAHLRGGGELGRSWWDEGRLHKKHNSYDDLFAIAEDLVVAGRTAPDRLAVTGASHGGLMVGVAITERPDLWRAAVLRVPVLDILGSCRDPYGRAAIVEELGDPDDPEDVDRLAAISAYHLVVDGTEYPAAYIDVGSTDPRCPPWHGRKFAARLQEATASERPILLRVWDAGHGWATAKDVEIAQTTAWLAFVMNQLSMELAARTPVDAPRTTTTQPR